MSTSIDQLRRKIESEEKIVGIGAYPSPMMAKLIEQAGFDMVSYQSVPVSAHYALPDGTISPSTQVEDVFDISRVTDLPILVDMEDGFGSSVEAKRYIRDLERAGASMIHVDDSKPGFWHCPGLTEEVNGVGGEFWSPDVIGERIREMRAASEEDIVISARTSIAILSDAEELTHTNEELFEAEVRRLEMYKEAGADVLWPPSSASSSEEGLKRARNALDGPLLAQLHTFDDHPKILGHQSFDAIYRLGYSILNCPYISGVAYQQYRDALDEIKETGSIEGVADDVWDRGDIWEQIGQDVAIELQKKESEGTIDC